MMQANTPKLEIPENLKIRFSGLAALTRKPRFVAAALGFAAVNAAAAVTILLWTPETQLSTGAVPPVTVSRLTPSPASNRVILDTVVRRLPRAQTWHPPHQLPTQRVHASAPDLSRAAPAGLSAPRADGLPQADTQPVPQALAALPPSSISPEPQPEVLNASLMPRIATIAGVRPRMRPEFDLTDVTDGTQVAVSLRPMARPEGLKVPEPRIAAAPETAVPETTLASLPRSIERPVGGAVCNTRLTRAMPNRKGSAKGGKSVMSGLMRVSGTERDRRVAGELMAGNMPSFLQDLVPVEVSGRARDGAGVKITFCVTPDYLAVGNNRDFVRVPMGLPAAMQVAGRFDMMLPTRRMVDQIYRASDKRVAPSPMKPGPQMSSTDYLVRHNATVETQVRGASVAGHLIAGHKKDLVLTNRLNKNRGRVAIYGWHRTNGKAIQPLSTVHGATYADYSHGVRLVSQTAYLNGRPVRLADLMADPDFASLISDEGPIRAAQLRVASAN
ncbi:hypothetical protein [Antarctobacter sp.]|uniref:hypothetical protein n=1 Tax=Antarctobacter sp. TaxID=1872577 RepID=UPI002B26C395|nr:hypothetical protein [Antarctobacter sp.]